MRIIPCHTIDMMDKVEGETHSNSVVPQGEGRREGIGFA